LHDVNTVLTCELDSVASTNADEVSASIAGCEAALTSLGPDAAQLQR
jgi:hypothetical protein